MNINRRVMKLFSALCLTCLTSICFASENNKVIEPIITQPEPVEMVMLCPDDSQHEGELIPK